MAELAERWDNPDEEYRVLSDLLVPAALADYDRAIQDWSALDAKTFGLLALVAAVIAGLAAGHAAINDLWWVPAVGCGVAGMFFIAAIWPRELDLGPDVIDFHNELRDRRPVVAARAMVEGLTSSTDIVGVGYAGKSRYFEVGLVLLTLSFLGCVPVLIVRT